MPTVQKPPVRQSTEINSPMGQVPVSVEALTLVQGYELQLHETVSVPGSFIDPENSVALNVENYVQESRLSMGTAIVEVQKQVTGLGYNL